MRVQKKTPARFGDRALGFEFPHIMERNSMRKIRNRAPVRNHYRLPLFRWATEASPSRPMSFAARHIARRYSVGSSAHARLIAEINGCPGEEV